MLLIFKYCTNIIFAAAQSMVTADDVRKECYSHRHLHEPQLMVHNVSRQLKLNSSLACLWWSRIPTTGRYHGRVLQSLGRSNTSDCSPMKLVNVVLPCLVIGLTVNADPCKRVACLCFVIRIWLLFDSSVCFFICSVIVCVYIVSIEYNCFQIRGKRTIARFL